jgi:toxin ParE1/3/4
MKGIGYEADATDELDRALAASPDPQAFRAELDTALQDIASGLRQHPLIRRTPCRECILPGLPYSVIYTETDDTVRVVALAHHRRRRGYWKDRLDPT